MKAELETVRAFFRLAPFMVDLGVDVTDVGDGRVSTALVLQPRHLQHTGQAHAGVTATLADHSMGAAAQTLAPAGHWVITAELKTSLLRPATGERLVCDARGHQAGPPDHVHRSRGACRIGRPAHPGGQGLGDDGRGRDPQLKSPPMRSTLDFLLHDWLGVRSLLDRPALCRPFARDLRPGARHLRAHRAREVRALQPPGRHRGAALRRREGPSAAGHARRDGRLRRVGHAGRGAGLRLAAACSCPA